MKWITRERPKIDRIACPWLIARFIAPYVYNDLKREHLVRTGSVVLHELYFENLGGNGHAGSAEREAIAQAFGSFDAWESEFRRIGARIAALPGAQS